MEYETSMTVDGDTGYAGQQAQAYLDLWASKLLTHRKDYESKNFKIPALSAGSSLSTYKNARPAEQAEYWVFTERSNACGSFEWVCSLFGVDCNRVRTIMQPNWRVLYGSTKFMGTETQGQAVLQATNNATPVVQANGRVSRFRQPHPTGNKPTTPEKNRTYP